VFTVHLSNTSFLYPVDDMPLYTPDGVAYHRILNPAIAPRDSDRPLRFYAVSFHPGLRRTADYQVSAIKPAADDRPCCSRLALLQTTGPAAVDWPCCSRLTRVDSRRLGERMLGSLT
jgi:hypothetical protein